MANVVPSPVLTDRFAQAFAFASIVHASQTRKGTAIPYLAHVIAVASFVLEHAADEDTAIAALLHDAPEDQGGYAMLAQIKARFGERVAKIVAGCTDTFEDPKPDWPTRKQQYLAHLADPHDGADLATCTVSVADKLHNARSILHDLHNVGIEAFDRFDATQRQLGWYYGSLAQILHRRLAGEPAIALAVALLHALDEIAAYKGCEMFGGGVEHGFRGDPCPTSP
jgi:(p)ppGpp synthase/HD superfamily hydrolase